MFIPVCSAGETEAAEVEKGLEGEKRISVDFLGGNQNSRMGLCMTRPVEGKYTTMPHTAVQTLPPASACQISHLPPRASLQNNNLGKTIPAQ
jgi:hypothetical protein